MARTRGRAPARGGRISAIVEDRTRLTMLVRNRQGEQRRPQHGTSAGTSAVHEPVHQHIVEPVQQDQGAADQDPFPGGPYDRSVLISYGREHVAARLWLQPDLQGDVRVISHGTSVSAFAPHAEIEALLRESKPDPLRRVCYKVIDKGLITAFVDRWHSDTSSFHLPIGEMTVTLDDVSQLLHILVMGTFYTMAQPDRQTAYALLTELLGVPRRDADLEIERNIGIYVRLEWLRNEVYMRCCDDGEWDMAARAYLLHLVGTTLFAEKSGSLTRIGWLHMFRDLSSAHTYAWGAMALTHLYDQLKDASMFKTKQVAGFATLLQAWIREHFQTEDFGSRNLCPGYQETLPRASRWDVVRGAGLVRPYRHALDTLTVGDVTWDTYVGHRQAHKFYPISLFRGFIRFGTLVYTYLPDRVLRQFGHVQRIPDDPRDIRRKSVNSEEMDERWLHFDQHVIALGARVEPGLPDVEPGYMDWFRRISHPYIYPDHVPIPDPPPSPPDAASWARVSETAQAVMDRRLHIQPNTDGWQPMLEL